jgi:UDP-N-acetylglucosamine--N-acetylmuramyl-(pentapeptide) pyrophosphoryl-undecaprenol N-acetylglucosamine transferase
MTKKVVVIAAGGTGGHLFPAAAFAEEMFRRGWRVVLMTDARGRRYAEGFPAERIEDVPAASISANPITAIPAAVQNLRGINEAKARFKRMPSLRSLRASAAIHRFPALMAARAQKVPILIHEQNSVLGRVNRAMATSARSSRVGSSASIGSRRSGGA